MENSQRMGGVAGLVAGVTFLVGLVMAGTVLADYTLDDPEPSEAVRFLVDHQAITYVWNTIIFIVFGAALVVLALALRRRLSARSSFTTQAATAFGLIWAGLVFAAGMIANIGLGTIAELHGTDVVGAETVWSALDAVQSGIGGGIEVVGGLWVLLVSWAALRAGALPKALNYLGFAAGAAAVVTIVPALEIVGAVFGLGLIVWFAGVGIVMLRTPAESDMHADASPPMATTT